ncbi:hypothetical protein ACOJUR_14800 [Alicyclobacillus tolerans]|uniref:Threonine synthase n=1 Tax=Alicyclobacillus tolerans TaxID=90970 RepID=A0ABT9LUV2_9BACL|nr:MULTISPECIES: hypothetical protein [Alicyclobacillus]MDP9728037.1 hypothetical protein [Alicyclobacillus tengchongensis]QRF24319.1 hypothetical protein FY534_12310 [Alicyclobacillus sp. TC]
MASQVCPGCNASFMPLPPFDVAWTCPSCGQVLPPEERYNPLHDSKYRLKYIMEQYVRYWLHNGTQ